MNSIYHEPEMTLTTTRKNGLPLLGDGCVNCGLRDKCQVKECNVILSTKYKGVSDLTSAYYHYKDVLQMECYVREYKYGYYLLVNGEKYKSGLIEEGWRIHFYDKNMKSDGFSLKDNGEIVERRGKKYLHIKGLKRHYDVADYIPLENSKYVLLM